MNVVLTYDRWLHSRAIRYDNVACLREVALQYTMIRSSNNALWNNLHKKAGFAICLIRRFMTI